MGDKKKIRVNSNFISYVGQMATSFLELKSGDKNHYTAALKNDKYQIQKLYKFNLYATYVKCDFGELHKVMNTTKTMRIHHSKYPIR